MHKAVVAADDGVRLAGAEFGTGAHGVVLLHQRGGTFCGFWAYGHELAAAGFHVLAIDFRGNGFSDDGDVADFTADAIAAIEWLKANGASKVVLVGASIGASTAVVTAGRHPDAISGLVTLSYPGDLDVTGGHGGAPSTAAQAAPKLTMPMLLCWAKADTNAVDPQAIAGPAPSTDKQVVKRTGASHGWDMLRSGTDDVRPELLQFLQRTT